MRALSRREALKELGVLALGSPTILRGQERPIQVVGRPVEIVVASLSPTTIRITVLPVESGRAAAVPGDGALVREELGREMTRGRSSQGVQTIKAGGVAVRFTTDPPMFHVETSTGEAVQRLTLDAEAPGLRFLLGRGPVLGLGQGGPQFDRK